MIGTAQILGFVQILESPGI